MAKITITDLHATQHGESITVIALVNGQHASIEFNIANIEDMDNNARKAFIRERLIATQPHLHDTYDLGFDKL